MSAHATSLERMFPRPSASTEPFSPTSAPVAIPIAIPIAVPIAIPIAVPLAAPVSALVTCVSPSPASSPSAQRPAAPLPPSFAASLLAGEGDDGPLNLAREATRFGVGLGLSSLYGIAIGARQGGLALFSQAAIVPSALLAIAALGVPALYIGLALFDAPLAPARLVSATARSSARTGLVLAGLAPAAALFVVTTSDATGAAFAAAIGLLIAGVLGLRGILGELSVALAEAPLTTRTASRFALLGFGVFAIALALRLWLPGVEHVGGGR
jgi:hypothetical protein